MSLLSEYKSFINSPSAASLAEDASLDYITTLTSVQGSSNIIKQLASQQLKRQEQTVLDAVEGQLALSLEIETTIEFVSGGGAYLPGLDDNFLADRVVTFPIIHVVHFNREQKIQRIRLHWDQGSLLKSIDVIGARGKNWPIRDGTEQVHLIASGSKPTVMNGPADDSTEAPAVRSSATDDRDNRSNKPRDPYATLPLFNGEQSKPETPKSASIAPRASAKPAPRDYSELFVGNDSDASPSPASKGRSFAGGKQSEERPVPRKTTLGNQYQPSRLFDEDDSKSNKLAEALVKPNPQKFKHFELGDADDKVEALVKPNPQKYRHFDLGGGDEKVEAPKQSPTRAGHSKHMSHWDFEDFVTPHKPVQKLRGQDVRHFGWSDDEVNLDSPVKTKKAAQPRRDAETHFEFKDDGTPREEKRPPFRPVGSSRNDSLGLYQNNLYDENAAPSTSPPKQSLPLGNVTNINNHRKQFSSQFTMSDDSPSSKDPQPVKPHTAEPHTAAVKMMDSSWAKFDEEDENSNEQQSKKENMDENKRFSRGIKTSGDGMGGRTGVQRQWGFGDDSGGEDQPMDTKGRNVGKKQQQQQQATSARNSFWDF